MKKSSLILACSAVLLATPASAHHSFAMFDMNKSIVLKGTVKELQWTNPHIWVQVVVREGKKPPVEWGLEGGNTLVMKRSGWTRDSLKPGDAISVVVNPAKAGGTNGHLGDITMADGRMLTSRSGRVVTTDHVIEGQK